MKALTIKQPWATLIVEGLKKYEFRTWKTNYRGKILIHAGLSLEQKHSNKFKDYKFDYIKGAIIGEVEIIDCVLVDEELNKKLQRENILVYGNDHIGVYAWKLDNVKKYKIPIYIKGKLGLWNYEEEI